MLLAEPAPSYAEIASKLDMPIGSIDRSGLAASRACAATSTS